VDPEAGGGSAGELALVRDLERLLDRQVPTAVSLVQVPTFVGDGSALAVETERRLADAELAGIFEKAAGVELWEGSEAGPTTRDTTGRDRVLVSRVRRDPSAENGLLLWAASDPLRLAASNVAKLAEARLRLH
jgi:aspartate-semialdehyde dehydrogenase